MRLVGPGQGRPAFALVVFIALHACNKDVEFTGASADKKNPEVVFDQEFPAARNDKAVIDYRPAFGIVDEALTLHEKPMVQVDLAQIERTVGVDSFQQGHDGNLYEEEFDISKAGKLDLLVVVDDSDSMKDEQDNLASKLSALTKHLKTTDWQVAVITTTSCALRNNGKTIKSSDANAEALFATAVAVGTGGSGDERGIYRAYQTFSGGGVFEGCDNTWLRPDASLAMLFVSDEDNFCKTLDCPTGSKIGQLEDLLTDPKKMNRKLEMLKSYALIWDNKDPKCVKKNGETKGTTYINLADDLNGITSSICQDDYTQTLEQISKDVSRIVKREFDLKFEPAAGVANATIDGAAYTDFDLTGKKLKLKEIGDAALKLKVTYRYDATPKFDKVKLTGAIDPQTLHVYVNNVELPATGYQFDAVENEVSFVQMPEDNAAVKAKYRRDDSLPRDFDLADKALANPITKVVVDGKDVTGYQFDEATQVLSFAAAPLDGAKITVFTKPLDPQITEYAATHGAVAEKLPDVSVSDVQTGEAVAVIYDGARLEFDAADVFEGRAVTVSYNYGDKDLVMEHELPYEPIDGTLAVEVVSGDKDCINNIVLEGTHLAFQCDGDMLQDVHVTFDFVSERYNDFIVPVRLDPDSFIQVYVDGVRTFDFEQSGDVVHFAEGVLSADSIVRVVVTRWQ